MYIEVANKWASVQSNLTEGRIAAADPPLWLHPPRCTCPDLTPDETPMKLPFPVLDLLLGFWAHTSLFPNRHLDLTARILRYPVSVNQWKSGRVPTISRLFVTLSGKKARQRKIYVEKTLTVLFQLRWNTFHYRCYPYLCNGPYGARISRGDVYYVEQLERPWLPSKS